ncbi:MAG TPA: trypsin-like peptidase domain-containing protein [Burkholderiales bacterium]|jgi:S1-C subfamily serine protease|nr:trypsin-like peptidase domain-containing protein [Burkholderiales bacterium]
MKRAAIYSTAGKSRGGAQAGGTTAPPAKATEARHAPGSAANGVADGEGRVGAFLRRHASFVLFVAGGLFALALLLAYDATRPARQDFTQEDIDAAVLHTLENESLPSRPAKAAAAVLPSVVRVRGYVDDGGGELMESATGSGVVIIDQGVILTNLHVVQGAEKVTVTFFDGLESEASVAGVQPENDLAVVKAKTIPDDLAAATLGNTQRLKLGDEVVAVGFPFGIGPSVSAGVVSGLNREFRSPDGQQVLTKLIQFDAAANPGSSGGPLVTMDGEVVGIVTAIFSPGEVRTFIGIGFAVTIEAAGNAVGLPPF